jgi:hypothetical protein
VESTLSTYHDGVGESEAINGPLLSSASSWLDRRSRRSGVYQRSSLLFDFGGIGLRRNSQTRQASRGCVHERHFSQGLTRSVLVLDDKRKYCGRRCLCGSSTRDGRRPGAVSIYPVAQRQQRANHHSMLLWGSTGTPW